MRTVKPTVKRLLITTTCRNANVNEPSGHLYVFDLDKWETSQRGSIIEPPFRDVDPNPRGGFRGGKGLAIFKNQVILANSVGVFLFDQKPVRPCCLETCLSLPQI